MAKVLKKDFFNRPILKVAEELVGAFLVRKIGKKMYRYKITEVEAYDGPHDLASHASKGKTERTQVMFDEAGRFYIYLIYGMYWMLNIVTGPKDYPAAILIRGVESLDGPGKLTKALKIDKKFNNKEAVPETGLWFEKSDAPIPKNLIKKTPRIGVDYAGPTWSKKKYRFVLKTK